MKILFRSFFVACLLTAISGCADNVHKEKASPVQRPKACFQNSSIFNKFRANGVQVIQIGDSVTFILSTRQFFVPNAPTLKTDNYPILNNMIALLSNCENYAIKVVGYTDSAGWAKRNLALSRQQALAIADYFWRHGVDTRVLYSSGGGSSRPVATETTSTGRILNQRIEIYVRLLHPEDVD